MAKKKKVLKVTPVLVLLNILIIIIICTFYLFRLIKYYRLEHNTKPGEPVKLVDYLIKKQSHLDLTKGLVLDEKTGVYNFVGNVDDNYISYSGMLYRILSIDKDNNIRIVSEDILTYMYSGLENGYEESFVLKWLNSSDKKYSGIYEKTLFNKDELLVNSSVCVDTIDDLNNITCEKVNSDYKVGMLSLYDYKFYGGKNGFLNNGKSYYLSSLNSENENYYMLDTGEIALNQSNSKVSGVRAVITINGDTIMLSGEGTLSDPYTIESHTVNKLNEAYVGQYVSLGEDVFKVVEINQDKVKVAMVGVLKDGEENLNIGFSARTNKYSKDTIVGQYLNKDYYNSLENKEYIVEGSYPVGNVVLSNLDYALVYNETNKANIGMLTLGDMFVHEYNNVFTLSRGLESSEFVNVINEDGNFYSDYNYKEYNVRPAMYLDGNLSIVSGIGSKHGPYQLGEVNEQEG